MSVVKVNNIFFSLQGETSFAGLPTVFIRLSGCPIRCSYCDTTYAYREGKNYAISDILPEVAKHQAQYVVVTGGEPLAQAGTIELLKTLCDHNYCVLLETSGTEDISKVDHRVIKIMDIKTPGSGMSAYNLIGNLEYITKRDQIKFVICNKKDYMWAKNIVQKHSLYNLSNVLFSPSWEEMAPRVLADWIVQDKLKVRFQLQLHKIIWGDVPNK